MNFFFVYDTAFCKSDEEDPKDAVVLFFPVQASESQGQFLCCQLAGVAKFLKTTFSAPSVIGLEHGKFAFIWSGNYLLGLGASSDVHTGILKDQLIFLCGIFCFYHGNMGNVLKECKNNRYEFLLKLELSWSRYVTLTQGFGNVLQLSLQSLTMKTGKKGSSVVANRLLHLCQMSSCVIAGAVFYNSRVLATQFTPQFTNYLSLLSNSNASAPVSDAQPRTTHLPPDVELKCVYLSPKWMSSFRSSGARTKRMEGYRNRAYTAPIGSLRSRGSGSEGDVDSGNCSESVFSQGDDTNWKWQHCMSRLDSCINCCTFHAKLFERRASATRNRYFRKESRRRDHHVSGIHLTKRNSKQESVYKATSVPCPPHAKLLSGSPSSRHSEVTSSADAEFHCSLCRSYNHSARVSRMSLKKWNSDPEMSSKHWTAMRMEWTDSVFTSPRHRSISECSPMDTKKAPKGRSKSDTRFYRSKPFNVHSHKRHSKDSKTNSAKFQGYSAKETCVNIEENDLEQHVLYVQRYGGGTLVLLLGRHYDEKAINYLWNCGFSVLRELELSSEKQESESPYNIEPSFYILLYNHVQRILKEYPHFPSLLLTEKHSKQTIQKIQEDFKMDAKFLTICLLSSQYSIFASHKDPNLAFYLQPECNSRKLDPLVNLQVKATRRLAKYFKVNPV